MIDTVLFTLAVVSFLGLMGMMACYLALVLFDKSWDKAMSICACLAFGGIALGMIFLMLSEVM